MRRRNLIVTSDSDEDYGESPAASASASVASGSGSGDRPSLANPSPLPVPFPSLSLSPSGPVVISDDDEEQEVEEVSDSDGDAPFIDACEDISPPVPAPPPPPRLPSAGTPTPTPEPFPASTQTPTPTPPAGITSSDPAPIRTPTPTPPPAAAPSPAPAPTGTPTPTPPPTGGPSPATHPSSTPPPSTLNGRLRPVDEFLRGLGLRLRSEWLESCAAGLPGFDGLGGAEARARRCFDQFLFADMNYCGAGVLPEGVGSMHAAVLDGPFVLQVDEIVSVSAPLRERYRAAHAGPKRCLKLSMTDGIQRIFGMEYRPIKDLEVLAPAGLKVVIRNVHIRRGLLMLVPEVVEILGGVVDDLEAARDRLVSEVNKPPRGKRKQGGIPLLSRATLAAWPCSTNVTNGGEQGTSLPATVNSSHSAGLGNASRVGTTSGTLTSELVNHPIMATIVREESRHVQESNMRGLSTSRNNIGTSASVPSGHGCTHNIREEYGDPSIMANNCREQVRCVQEVTMQEQATAFVRTERRSPTSTLSNHGSHAVDDTGANGVEVARFSSLHVQEINMQDLSSFRNNTETSMSVPNGHDRTQTIKEEYVDPCVVAKNDHKQVQCVQEQASSFVRIERSPTSTPYECDSHHGSHAIGGTAANDVETALTSNIDDEINHMEHSIILSGENEKPFTYIFSMLADWGTRQDTQAYIQGKIKGLITSVKSFQYRRRSEYELYVYIDDGSYISMALVDHNVVKNMIGLSPEEVTAALSGESMLTSTSEMKETLRGFQRFLVNFEGMLLIELNKNSSLPIIREFSEGCSSSDAWLLLGRLKAFSSRGRMQSLDDMDTTP